MQESIAWIGCQCSLCHFAVIIVFVFKTSECVVVGDKRVSGELMVASVPSVR